MSTKIYTGYRIDSITPHALLTRLKTFGKHFRMQTEKRLWNEIAYAIARIIDAYRCTGKKAEVGSYYTPTWPIFTSMYYHFRFEVGKAYHDIRKGVYDFTQCEVSIFPIRSPNNAPPISQGASFLMVLYDQTNKFQDDFERIVKPTEFGYWNNTDRPDHLTATEWRKRGTVWERAMGKLGVPALVSFTFECMPNSVFPFISKENVLRRAQSLEKRREDVAMEIVFSGKVKSLKKPDDSIHDAFRWMLTREAKDKIREVRKTTDPLVVRLTRDDLETQTNKLVRFPKGWVSTR